MSVGKMGIIETIFAVYLHLSHNKQCQKFCAEAHDHVTVFSFKIGQKYLIAGLSGTQIQIISNIL